MIAVVSLRNRWYRHSRECKLISVETVDEERQDDGFTPETSLCMRGNIQIPPLIKILIHVTFVSIF
jgi:hypothetical protein